MTDFAQQRKNEDAAIVRTYGIRTRADVLRVAAEYGRTGDDPASLAFRDKLFCAAARHFGADACGACGNLAISNELNTFSSSQPERKAPSLCDACMAKVDEAVHALPQWVKDRDLSEIIPALVRAFVRTAQEAHEPAAV
jgi:hypothetical protein